MKITKQKLINLINKYYTIGQSNSVKWTIENNVLTVKFLTESSATGIIQLENIDLSDMEFGVYTTSTVLKMLNALDNDIVFDVNIDDTNEPESIKLSDGTLKTHYVLSTLDIIPKAPESITEPVFTTEIEINKEFIERFIKARSAMSDKDNVAITTKDNDVIFIYGYTSTSNQDNVSFKYETVKNEYNLEPINFSVDVLKNILSTNKDLQSGKMYLCKEGLLKVDFKFDSGNAVYYTTMLEND